MMKKLLILGVVAFLFTAGVSAQDRTFKLDKSSGKLKINISGIEVEGYDGNSILFSAPAKEKDSDDDDSRAQGLKQLNGTGNDDNTGLGISVKEKNDVIEVNAVDKWNSQDPIKIKVPNSMNLTVNTTSVFNKKEISIKDFKGEVEVSVVYNNVSLENIMGPLNAKSVYGDITAKFAQNIKGPISIVSVYRFVDATIPENLKANISMSTSYGKIYAAQELNIKRESTVVDTEDNENMREWTRSDNVKGTLNGGGLDFILKSSYGKIYLRKN